MNFTVQPTDTVKLDMASRSVGINLGAVYGVNKIQITPQNATHRVRQQDISVYISTDNNISSGTTADYTQVTGWTFIQNTDGSMVLEFPKIFQAQYIKINTVWDDRDINNASLDTGATVSNTAGELIKVWALKDSRIEQDTYDPIGNRQSQTVDGQTQNYIYYQNTSPTRGNLTWLASDGNWFYQYDNNGNLITKAKAATVDVTQPTNPGAFVVDTTKEYWNYSWDLRNRLSSVSKYGQPVVSYLYDADNLRVVRTKGSDTTVYAYGRNGAITYQKDLTTNTARTYTYLYDETIGWVDTATDGVTKGPYYATTDHLGSVTQVTNSSAAVVWSSEYQPFGKTAGVEGLYDFDGSYAGHQVDRDTGLIYSWNRWMEPETGRFISEDPAQDGNNWYAYAGNSPEVNTDPTGLWGTDSDGYSSMSPSTDSPSQHSGPSTPSGPSATGNQLSLNVLGLYAYYGNKDDPSNSHPRTAPQAPPSPEPTVGPTPPTPTAPSVPAGPPTVHSGRATPDEWRNNIVQAQVAVPWIIPLLVPPVVVVPDQPKPLVQEWLKNGFLSKPVPQAKHPWDKLPKKGKHPFKPPIGKGGKPISPPPRGINGGGMVDADDNEWDWDIGGQKAGKPHWDVKHPDGTHTNVNPAGGPKEGEVNHGLDNF